MHFLTTRKIHATLGTALENYSRLVLESQNRQIKNTLSIADLLFSQSQHKTSKITYITSKISPLLTTNQLLELDLAYCRWLVIKCAFVGE